MNVAVEWKDVLIESLKGAVILAILERFYVTRTASWFEDHIGKSWRPSHAVDCCNHPGQRLTAAARRLLLHSEPAVQPLDHECLPAVAAAVEAHEAHQQRLDRLILWRSRLKRPLHYSILYSRHHTRFGSAALVKHTQRYLTRPLLAACLAYDRDVSRSLLWTPLP